MRHLIVVIIMVGFGAIMCKGGRQQGPGQEPSLAGREHKSSGQALPKLVVKEGNHQDMGKIREGIRTSVVFTLINRGEAEASNIRVHDLSQGGCTAVTNVSRLAAGDSARLKFIFETLGYGGKKETREIRVRYDNPGLSPLKLSVTAEVLPAEEHQVPIGELFYNFFVLVDVRDEKSFRKGHIAGAINVPAEEVLSWAANLPDDFMIYLYSEAGLVSDTLAKELRSKGYSGALSMIGGIREWKRMYGERVIIPGTR